MPDRSQRQSQQLSPAAKCPACFGSHTVHCCPSRDSYHPTLVALYDLAERACMWDAVTREAPLATSVVERELRSAVATYREATGNA